MFDASNRQPVERDRSLLSLTHAEPKMQPRRSDPEPQGSAASLLDLAGGEREADPVLRHRIARSRRQAHESPLLEALARSDKEGQRPEQPASRPAGNDRKGSPAERLSGWMGRLFGASADRHDDSARIATGSPAETFAREPQGERFAAEPSAEPEPAVAAEPAPGERQDYWQPLIDPFKVIGGIGKSRWLIIGTTLVGALIGVVIALSTPKQYEAYTELVVDPRDLKLTERELTTTGLPSDATLALVENQARVLTSSLVLNKVVAKLNLAEDPEFNGQAAGAIGLSTVIDLLRSLLSGPDAGADDGRRHSLAVEHLGESLTVERGGRTFVIVITVKTRDREKSALIANTMTEVFMQVSGELQADTAGRATDELTARLDELRGGLEEAERKIAAFKAEHDIVDPQGRLITDDEIVKVNDQLAVAKARTIELNARAATARGVTATAAVSGALPEELASPVMTELRSQYAAVKQESDRLAIRLGPRHPTRLAADAQVAGALDRIGAELRRISSSLQVDLQRAVEQEQSLAARLAQLKVRQGGIGDDLVTLRELEREAAAKRAVYEAFLLRARETAEQRDINAANVTVISPAYPPLDPVGPGRSTIAMAGTFLGLLFGIGLGAARGGWESLRENMAARPRRRRRGAGVGKPDGEPPQTPRPGNRGETPKDASDMGKKMGLFSRFRRAPAPAPSSAATPGHVAAGHVPPSAEGAPPVHPGTYAAVPAYGWPPAPQPPVHAAAGGHSVWLTAPQPVHAAASGGHPGWPPLPSPSAVADVHGGQPAWPQAPQPSAHAAVAAGHMGWPAPQPSVHAAAPGGYPGWPQTSQPSMDAAVHGGHPGWPQAPQPSMDAAVHGGHPGWPQAPQPSMDAAVHGGHPGWPQAPQPSARAAAGWPQPHLAAPPPVHPAYQQPPVHATHYTQPPVAPAPVEVWPATRGWHAATPPTYPPQPVYTGTNYLPESASFRRPAAEALQPAIDHSAIDEIRESLREFRDAVQGLAEQRRRYS